MARSRATLQPDWASADLRRRINGGECTRSRGIPDTRPHRASPNLGPFGGAIPFIPHKDVGFYRCVRKGCANGCYVLLRPQVLHAGFHGLAIERPPNARASSGLHRAGNIDEPAWLIRVDRYRCDMILGHRRTQQVDSMTVPLARMLNPASHLPTRIKLLFPNRERL